MLTTFDFDHASSNARRRAALARRHALCVLPAKVVRTLTRHPRRGFNMDYELLPLERNPF